VVAGVGEGQLFQAVAQKEMVFEGAVPGDEAIVGMQAAFKKALHSAAFAKFIGQAVQAALTEVQGITLTPEPTTRINFDDNGCACSYEARSADRKSLVRMQRSFENLKHPEKRHQWYGYESHTDALGRVWSTPLPHMVQDDFGNLVEVPA